MVTPLTTAGNNSGQGSSTSILPNDNIYALISDGSALYIGTSNGAVKWDGFNLLISLEEGKVG